MSGRALGTSTLAHGSIDEGPRRHRTDEATDANRLIHSPSEPVVDGDGINEVGLHRESTGFFYYRNTLSTGVAHGQFLFGDPGD